MSCVWISHLIGSDIRTLALKILDKGILILKIGHCTSDQDMWYSNGQIVTYKDGTQQESLLA